MIYNTWNQSVLSEAEKEHVGNMFSYKERRVLMRVIKIT